MDVKRFLSLGMQSLPFWGPGGNAGWGLGWRSPSQSINYEEEIGPLHLNSIVAIAISRATMMFMEAPPIIQQRIKDGPDGQTQHEGTSGTWLERLLEHPNEHMDASTFWAGVLTSWMTDGNVYLFAPLTRTGERSSLMILPPWQVRPKSDHENRGGLSLITHYEYTPIGGTKIDIPAEFIIQQRQGFDPLDQRRGMSPLKAQFPHVYGDNAASVYTAGLLRNFGVPSVAFSMPQGSDKLTPQQVEMFKTQMREHFRGEAAGRPAVVPFPIDANRLGFSPAEMSLKELANAPLERICPALGFDPMVLGLPSNSKTYSNLEEANRAAWKGTISPMKRIMGSQLTKACYGRQSAGPGDYRVWWEFDNVPELQEDRDKRNLRVREDYKADLIDRHTALSETGRATNNVPNLYYSEARGLSRPLPSTQGPGESTGKGLVSIWDGIWDED
jgi:HK97 family phage portal protein